MVTGDVLIVEVTIKIMKFSCGRCLCQRMNIYCERVLAVSQRFHLSPDRVIVQYKRPSFFLQVHIQINVLKLFFSSAV